MAKLRIDVPIVVDIPVHFITLEIEYDETVPGTGQVALQILLEHEEILLNGRKK